MALKLYNTLTGTKEIFEPIDKEKVGLYSCGPTVYARAHIGNMRTYIFNDILYRILLAEEYKVDFIQNVTDVGHLSGDGDDGEDKLEIAAKRERLSAWDVSQKYFEAFASDIKELNILPPRIWVKATDHITDQIELVKKLEQKGFTYTTSDGVYFDTSRITDYGKLANLRPESLMEGARVEINREKKNITDFALWKFSTIPGQRDMEWPSPWGMGFPGWHIECSAMSMKYLGEKFDIHTGGVDFIPLHHTNEITQNEACTGHKVVNFWLHGEFLTMDGKKMSKSLGNIITVEDIKKKGFHPLAFRYFTMSAHYRQKLNFTWEGLEAAANGLNRLKNLARDFSSSDSKPSSFPDSWKNKFANAVADDLSVPQALSALWDIMRDKDESPSNKYGFLIHCDKILGLSLEASLLPQPPAEVSELASRREKARTDGLFEEADQLRKKMAKLGYTVKDTPKGPEISPL